MYCGASDTSQTLHRRNHWSIGTAREQGGMGVRPDEVQGDTGPAAEQARSWKQVALISPGLLGCVCLSGKEGVPHASRKVKVPVPVSTSKTSRWGVALPGVILSPGVKTCLPFPPPPAPAGFRPDE